MKTKGRVWNSRTVLEWNSHIISVYSGEFEFGEYNGYGTLSFKDGRKILGNWKNSKPVGQITLISADGSSKEASWDHKNEKYIYIDKGMDN